MPSGGKRENSGRKYLYGVPSTQIYVTVPLHLAHAVPEAVHKWVLKQLKQAKKEKISL